ncbi:MAG: PstS family phosphate ABC transporter substrate-binding protein [Candidatus Thorarchaeota archaeon]
MRLLRRQTNGLIVGVIIGVALGVGGLIFISPPPSEGTHATITTAGSSTVYPLSVEWSTMYSASFPGITVNPSTGGSGLGQSLVAQGLVDIGASSSYPEAEYFDLNPQVQVLPMSADALGVVVHQSVNGSSFKMDCDMVVAVFQRNVTTWAEFSSVFGVTVEATGPIDVFVRSDASGTTATFAKWLETAGMTNNSNGADYEWTLGHDEAISFPSGVLAVDGNPGVASGVAGNPDSIGYVGLAFLNVTGLTPVSLFNPGNGEWVEPSVANAIKAIPTDLADPGESLMNSEIDGAYPIARLLYYIVNRDNLQWYTISFITWCLVQGQNYVGVVGYVPINGTSAQQYSLSIVAVMTPSGG